MAHRKWMSVRNRATRLAALSDLLAAIDGAAAAADGETTLLQHVCDLVAQRADIAVVWVGVPAAEGDGRVAAATAPGGRRAGLAAALGADIAEGRGPAGHAWRDGAVHLGRPDDAADGRANGAAARIDRGGAPWGILNIRRADGRAFGPDLRLLMGQAARTIARGLRRLDEQASAHASADVLDLLMEHTYTGISIGRERVIALANRYLVEMLGYDRAEDLIGQSTRILYATDEDFERVGNAYQELRAQGMSRVPGVRIVRRDGQEIIGDVTMDIVRDGDAETVVWTVENVTERVALERDLQQQAHHDVLTGLPNRRGLETELARAVERARRNGTTLVVGMLDLDDFKMVNDALGHEAGDRALCAFAHNLRSHLRNADFAARPGGDEFVILLEDFPLPFDIEPLEAMLRRLQTAVEVPLQLAPGHAYTPEMSLGVAIFPGDGSYGEELLRKADRALFDLKAHKRDRSRWWQLASWHGESEPVLETNLHTYGREASALLSGLQDVFAAAAADFVAAFYRRLRNSSDAEDILSSLGEAAMERLRTMQGKHMRFLCSPSTSRKQLRARARELGEIHNLVGVSPELLTRAAALYRELLTERLNQTLWSGRQRYRILLLVEQRLQDDLESQLQAMQDCTAAYLGLLSQHLPDSGTRWADASVAELERLGELPGVAGVMLLRLVADGQLAVERSCGSLAVDAMVQQAALSDRLKAAVGEAPGATVTAWRNGEILSVANFTDDARFAMWWDMAREAGARSMLAIPVLSASGHTDAGICLLGRYPNQFESVTMRQFAQSAARRWEELWRRSALPSGTEVVPQEVAHAYRERLFAGGLRMLVQPMVDLQAGRVVQVEALARLQQPGGDTVSPARFLPLLGDVELARVFRVGLDQALGYLVQWDAAGTQVGVTLNLAPSTLVIPECAQWVADALARHRVSPHRLTLELLETTAIDEAERAEAIARLTSLGVQLAIDDLGSGYSSLQRLATLPFHMVKIDQSLLQGIREDPQRTLVLIDALIGMARRLGREVVMEGLEHPDMIEVAALLGATLGQGFGLARPMPWEDLASWSKRFRLPIKPGAAHTYLGALAHHWKHGHALPITHCPLTRFLSANGLDETEPARWHALVHSAQGGAPHDALTEWLRARVLGTQAT